MQSSHFDFANRIGLIAQNKDEIYTKLPYLNEKNRLSFIADRPKEIKKNTWYGMNGKIVIFYCKSLLNSQSLNNRF
jgi:hypothetical protein